MKSPLLQWPVHFVWKGFLPQEITSLIPDCFSKTKAQGIPQFQRGGLPLEVVRNVTKKRDSKIRFCFKSNKFGTFGICVLWIFFTSPDPKYQRLYPPRGSVPEAFSISSQTQSNLLAQFGTFLHRHRFLSHVTHVGPASLAPCGKPVWALVLLALCMQWILVKINFGLHDPRQFEWRETSLASTSGVMGFPAWAWWIRGISDWVLIH